MKSFTDLEQSKKLAEFLPLESADMGWYYSCNPQAARNQMWLGTKPENADIPCWSLAALLEVIPKEQHPALVLNAHYRWISDISNPGSSFTYEPTAGDNPLDAVFEMILYLHKQKLL